MALFTGCTKLCLLAALVMGGIFGGQESEGASSTVRFLVLSCAVIYLLAITLTLLSRDRKKRAQRRREREERGLAHLHDESAHALPGPSDEPQGESVRTASNGESEQDDACEENLANAEQADESKATKEGKNGASSEDESFEAIRQELSELHGLTGREVEILGHLARGRTNTRIAEDLFISPSTVRGHIRHIYTKLDVHDRQEPIDLSH